METKGIASLTSNDLLSAIGEPGPSPEMSALLLIDFVNDVLTSRDGSLHPWAGDVVDRAASAGDWARSVGIPVFWVRVERRADGSDAITVVTDLLLQGRDKRAIRLVENTEGCALVSGLTRDPGDYDIIKRRVNAFFGTPLDLLLRQAGVTTLFIGGVYTNMGVEATVRAAYDLGYHSVVLDDCCASYSQAAHDYAINEIFPRIARVRSLEQVIAGVPH